jgi:peptidoglycan/LPS O-acetylase OafA/YrhL
VSRRLLGAALLVVAGVAAVVGTFLPLFSESRDAPSMVPTITQTSWEYVFSNVQNGMDLGDLRSPQYGVPIVVAALLLGVAAALVFLPESQRLASRYLAVGGTGVLVGVVLLHGRRSRPRPEGPVVYRVDDDGTDDTATPPFGFPAPEVEVARLPESEHDRRDPDA